jgi:hypothetical protein
MSAQAIAAEVWTQRRRRAADLAARWPFAGEVLRFYGAVLVVQEQIYERASSQAGAIASLARYIAETAVPPVRGVAASQGPERLARGVAEALPGTAIDIPRWTDAVGRWLSGQALPPVDRFVVRAAAEPVLRALGRPPGAGAPGSGTDTERRCPRCGGPPQLALLAPTGEDLVAPRRMLECARCTERWPYPRMTCPGCGEDEPSRLPIFSEEGAQGGPDGVIVRGAAGAAGGTAPGGRAAEPGPAGAAAGGSGAAGPRFPHLAVGGCRTCGGYLVTVDVSRDGRAVPVVDEMGAIPLDLYAREQGLRKIVPNLMGL